MLGPLVLVTVAVMAAMGILDQPIKTAPAWLGIVSFELAGDVPTAQAIVDSWDARARSVAGIGLGLDYLFMLAYSTTLALACLWATARFGRRGSALAAIGVPLAVGQWVAALGDGVENFALIQILLDGARDPWPGIAWWAAVTKFVLGGLGIAYVATAALTSRDGERARAPGGG